MKRIMIVGGGGFGLELYGYIRADLAQGRLPGHELAGVLDDSPECEVMRKATTGTMWLGPVGDYVARGGEAALIAVGNTRSRLMLAELMRGAGIPLFTYVHPSAWISATATIGEGTIVAPNCVVNADVQLSDNVAVNVFCSIGHSARVGKHSVLSPFSALSGDSSLGERCFLGTRATLYPKVTIGNACVVDAHSTVRQSVGDKKIVSVRGEYLVVDNRLDRS
jgi:sugar O-acyltransferase (sialic acid O-acetyltransferase NeuD family)